MDPLNDLTSEAHRLSSNARRCFLEGHPVEAKVILETLYDFLVDKIAGPVSDLCEPAESS